MALNRSSETAQFSSLPYEIYEHILSFGGNAKISTPQYLAMAEINSQIQFVANFQSLNRKISEIPEMKRCFDEFWWKVWENIIGMNRIFEKEFNILKDELIKNGGLKRKVLIAYYIKYKLRKLDVDKRKVSMIGPGGVGKTAIAVYFYYRIFVDQYDPTIEDLYKREVTIDDVKVTFDVLDSNNQGECFIFVCDLYDKESLLDAQELVEHLVRIKDREFNDFPTIFALNKLDLLKETERKQIIDEYTNEIRSIIEANNLVNYEIIACSAKTGENVDHLFEECERRKRYGTLDNLTLLRNVIKYDSEFIQVCGKKLKSTSKKSKGCLLE